MKLDESIKLKKKLRSKKIISYILIFILFCYIWGKIEYYNVKVKHILLESSEIPKEFDGKKIVFIADFQMDTMFTYNRKAVINVINKVNGIDKDIILMGGDYKVWTNKIPLFYEDMKLLNKPKLGVYAILGNHDYDIIGTENDKKYNQDNYYESSKNPNIIHLQSLGYNVLLNENKEIKINNDKIYIAGTQDYWSGLANSTKALEGIKKEDFTILMTHNPQYYVEDVPISDVERVDLALSGHTHGGQVTLFGLFGISPMSMRNWIPYRYGMKNVKGGKLYITSGLGGSALEQYVRFFAQPEIVVIELKKL